MSDHEILQRWNNALDKRAHVEILADLNAVSKAEMHQKLVELGAEGLPEAPKRRARKAPAEDWVNPNLKIDELKAMELYSTGACDMELADALGVTKSTVCSWRKRMRLAPHLKRRATTGIDNERAWELYNEGLCDLDMAEALGVSRNTVADWRKKHDLKCHRQKPGYVQRKAGETGGPSPKSAALTGQDRTGQDRTGQDRTGQDRTGQDRRAAPVGEEAPAVAKRKGPRHTPPCDAGHVGKQEYMGIDGLLRLTQRMQEAFPQAKVTAGGRCVRDARVHIYYDASGEAVSVELDLVLEVEANEGST